MNTFVRRSTQVIRPRFTQVWFSFIFSHIFFQRFSTCSWHLPSRNQQRKKNARERRASQPIQNEFQQIQMRRKGDAKVLENQVKMQQNSHLHGADNPTYLKSGSDKVNKRSSLRISFNLSFIYSSNTSHHHTDGYRCHLLFCWSHIFGNRKGYVQHVLWYQQGIRCVIILFLKIYITRYRFLKPHRKNRRTTNPCIYLTKRHTHTHTRNQASFSLGASEGNQGKKRLTRCW